MVGQALDMPWAATNELRRLAALPYMRLMFGLHGLAWGRGWRILGMPIIQRFRGSRIVLGDGLELRSWRSTNPLAPSHAVVLATRSAGALIELGRDVAMTGATLVAAERITIGDRVLIGANATIVDTDFHPLDPVARRRDILAGARAAVVIEDDVFVGMHSLILKGVRLGAGSVIGAGSVVTRDVPAGALVAGNPARIVRRAVEDSVVLPPFGPTSKRNKNDDAI
jgi:acetyltransferase-like isoleucine patch superfamily enzyme